VAGRSVKVLKGEGGDSLINDKESNSFSNFLGNGRSGPFIGFVVCGLTYIVGSIAAIPFLGIGLICKEIALKKDPDARNYQRLIQVAPQDQKLQVKKEALEQKLKRKFKIK
jgi:hypothetical protein